MVRNSHAVFQQADISASFSLNFLKDVKKKKKSDAKHVKSSKEKYYDSTLEFLPFDYFLLIGRAKSKIKKLRKANLQLFRELVSKDP